MSLSQCISRFEDGIKLYGSYETTADFMLTRLYASADHRWDMRVKDDKHARKNVKCDCKGEEVEIYCEYGGGFYFPGRACREHLVFKGPFLPWDYMGNLDEDPPRFFLADDGKPEWMEDER